MAINMGGPAAGPLASSILEIDQSAASSAQLSADGSCIASFGNVEREYSALMSGAALFDLSHLGRISHTGADVLDLLNRLSTNELLSLRIGEHRGTVLTSDRGRIVDVLSVMRRSANELLLLTASPAGTPAFEWIDRYTFDEDAVLADLADDYVRLFLAGPAAAALLAAISAPPAQHEVAPIALGRQEVLAARTDAAGSPSFDLLVDRPAAATVCDELIRGGAVPAGHLAFEAARIEQGRPAFGAELSERYNPIEAGLGSLISFDKGCYVGQEVVARLDTYDKVKRVLVGLIAEEPLAPGSSLLRDGREVGEITSSAQSLMLGRPVGLAYVRRGGAAPGDVLDAPVGEVRVVALPLVPAAA